MLFVCPNYSQNSVGADHDIIRIASSVLSAAGFATKAVDLPYRNLKFGIYSDYLTAIFGHRLRLLRELLKFDGQIVYAFFMPVIFYVSILKKAFRLNFRVVGFVSGSPYSSAPIVRALYQVLMVLTLNMCDGVVFHRDSPNIAYSKYTRMWVEVGGILVDSNKLTSYDSASASWRKEKGLERKVVVGVIGPFTSVNRPALQYVLKNMRRFDNRTFFYFIGDTISSDSVSDERVLFAGRVHDMVEALSRCDIVLIPRFSKTGAPMSKMIYSMAAGAAVVTNDPEGMKVKDGVEAVVGPLDSLPELVNYLVNHPEKRIEIGRNGRAYIKRFYDRATEGEKLAHFF